MSLSAILVSRTDHEFIFTAFDSFGPSALDINYPNLVWAPYVLDSSNEYVTPWSGITGGVFLSAANDYTEITECYYGSAYDYGFAGQSTVYTSGAFISGNTFFDQQTFKMIVSARDTIYTDVSAVISNSVIYTPYYMTIVAILPTLTSVELIAQFTDGINFFNLNNDMTILWTVGPVDSYISALSGDGIIPDSDYQFVSGLVTSLSAITAFSSILSSNFTYDIDLEGVENDAWRSLANFGFGVNPTVEYTLIQSPSTAIATSYINRAGQINLGSTDQILWTVSPIEGLSAQVMTPGGLVGVGTTIGPNDASSLSSITFVATSYENIHVISVSANPPGGNAYFGDIFIPYLDSETNTTYFVTVAPVTYDRTRFFQTTLKGVTNSIVHNINPDYAIAWSDTDEEAVRGYIGGPSGTEYIFVTSGGGLDRSRILNPLYVSVCTTEWDLAGVPGIDSYSLYVTGASGYDTPTDTLVTTVTTITAMHWVPDFYFYPNFSLNNELNSTIQLYRLLPDPNWCGCSSPQTFCWSFGSELFTDGGCSTSAVSADIIIGSPTIQDGYGTIVNTTTNRWEISGSYTAINAGTVLCKVRRHGNQAASEYIYNISQSSPGTLGTFLKLTWFTAPNNLFVNFDPGTSINTVLGLDDDTWYWIRARWDSVAHGTTTLDLTYWYADTLTEVEHVSAAGALTPWSSSQLLKIGKNAGTATNYDVDDFKVYNEWIDDIPLNALYTLTVHDSSIVPALLTTNTFDINITDSVSETIYASSTQGGFTAISSIFIPTVRTLTVDTTGSIALAGWPDVSIKTATDKFVNFVSFFPQTSGFIVYPETKWDGTQFVTITADPETDSEGVSAWGYCHTENFYLSAPSADGTFWYWSVENITPQPLSDTGYNVVVPIPATASTTTHAVSVQAFTSELPTTMPRSYITDDTGIGLLYPNFSDTSITDDIRMKDDITRPTLSNLGSGQNLAILDEIGVPAHQLVLSGVVVLPNDAPIEMGTSITLSWTISTAAWSYTILQNTTEFSANLIVVEIPDAINEIGLFVPTIIDTSVDITTNYKSKDVSVSDWCSETDTFTNIHTYVTAYPVAPYVYTSNKYVLVDADVIYQNLVPMFNLISGFNWTDRSIVYPVTTNSNYVTSYDTAGVYDLTLETILTGYSTSNTFSNIVFPVAEFTLYDSTVVRIIGQTVLKLLNSKQLCEVPPNEWITFDNMNRSFDKLNENLIYLDQQSVVYDAPPTEYFGWYGALTGPDGNSFNRWRVNIDGINTDYLSPQNAFTDLLTDCRDISVKSVVGVGDNVTLISNSTAVMLLSSDFFGTEISRITQKGVGDEFIQIESIDTDLNFSTDPRAYLLDSVKNRVLVFKHNFDTSIWKLLYSWGGLGSQQSRNKFRSPSDILVDNENKIWVTDRDNLCVKKFSRTGSWISTYVSSFFDANNKPRSTAIADDGTVHVLCDSSIVKLTANGVTVEEYGKAYLLGESIRSITTSQDQGFFYITTTTKVIKITQKGTFAGTFGDQFELASYKNLYHDANRNVYLAAGNAIIKYIDKLDPVNLLLDTTGVTWPMSAIYLEEEEYIQDWVVNKSLSRFYDNIEVFRRSVIGSFSTTIQNGIEVPVIRTLAPDEYKVLPYNKEDIYIGLNELVAAPVFNRCIDKLYECIDVVLDFIDD